MLNQYAQKFIFMLEKNYHGFERGTCLLYPLWIRSGPGTHRIYNFVLLLIEWVRSFSTMLPSVKFAEEKVFVFFILREKC